jgi:hypothetical protein
VEATVKRTFRSFLEGEKSGAHQDVLSFSSVTKKRNNSIMKEEGQCFSV